MSSPSSKPVFPQPTHSPPHLVKNAHSRSSPEKRKLGKRSKTLTSDTNYSSGVIISKSELQKGRNNCKTNPDSSAFCKTKETRATNPNERSPKKVKKSSVLLKSKKLSGQKKARKVRKKHKLKEKIKSMRKESEKVRFPEKGIEEICYSPEPYGGLHVPAVVRQVTTKSTKAESFTIKRTATPVLSSLLGQGAFRTCWPQSEDKSFTRAQEHEGNGNTGRHNTNFLGPKLPECNNETSEETNYSQTKQNIFWDKHTYNFSSQKGCGSNADTTTDTSLLFAGRAKSHHSSCFPVPNLHVNKHTLDTQEYRNPFNVVNKKETNGVYQNLRAGETRMNSTFKGSDKQRSVQFCAPSHAENLKQQTEGWNPSDKLVYITINPHDLNEKEGLPTKLKDQLPKEMIEGQGQTSKRHECVHLASNRNRYDIRQPEAWTQGGKSVHTSTQPKDSDVKVHREEMGKQYFNQDARRAQFPYVSFLTCDTEVKQRLSETEAIFEKRHVNNVKQHVDSKQQADVKPCFHKADKFHTAALPQCPDKAIPEDLKEFRNLRKPRVAEEGNVFRLTKNHMLPSRFKYDNPENVEACINSQERHEGNNYMWQDSENKTISMCCRHEARKGCSSRAVGLCTDVSHECSKQLDNTNAQSRKIQLNEQPQVVSRRTIKDEHKCVDKHKTAVFGAGHAQNLIPRRGVPSKVHDRRNTLASSPASPAAEEISDREIRVHDRLNQSNSSVLTTVGEASATDSDSTADRQHKVKGSFTQAQQAACVHYFKNQQVNDKGRVCDCRNHVVAFHGKDENDAVGQDHRREIQYHKRQPSEHPTGKASVYHGHVVKRNKSLISVRNMLNELTSHIRANDDSSHPTATAHIGKPRGRTLLYFKPTPVMRNDSLPPKEHDTSSMYKPKHCQVLRCSKTTEVTRNMQETGKFVTRYRPRRSKAYRHEPYRKRVLTSSESTVTPPGGGYHWTRNKNNCSPSRKGRYVLGPLVDKHVFPEQQHISNVAAAEVSGSSFAIGQEDNSDAVTGDFRLNARKPDTMALCNNSVQNQEDNRCNDDEKTKGYENTLFATSAFPKTRRIPEVITGKEHVDLWNQATSGQRQIRHTFAWPAVTIQQAADDSEKVQGDTCRVSRRPNDAGYTGPAETRYKIIRQYYTGCPETSHTVNISTGNATKGDTIGRQITKICTAKRSIDKRNTRTEYTDTGSAQADHTCGSHKDRIAHTVRHDNRVDPIPESEEPVEDTNRKGTESEDATSKRRHNEDSVTRHDSCKHEAGNKRMTDTTQQPATMKPTSAACVSMKRVSQVDTGADHPSVRFTTNKQTTRQHANIEDEDIGQHSTARNHDITVLCSENDLKGTGSLQIVEKNDLQTERRSNQLTLNTMERATHSQIRTDTGTGATELTIKNDDQPLFLSTTDKSESKPKAVSRTGNSRYQYNRSNITKPQLCLARLKASRGPLSMRYSASFDRNLRPSKAGVFSGAAGRLQFKNKQTPDTQSHTTQTENGMNSAHVAVQTSPGLHVAARRASRHSKMRRYLTNPKLYRDKITQKECQLSKHRLSGKPGVNVPDSVSASASQPVQLGTREYLANRNLEIQKETLLESRARTNDNQNITTVQAVTEQPFEQTVASIRSHKGLATSQTRTAFEDLSRNDKASNYQELQNSLWNERRDTRGNFGTEKEVPDKKESSKQEAETNTDSRRQDDRWNDRTHILGFSNTQLPGAQDKGCHGDKPSPHLDNKEKEKGAVGEVSCQTSKGLLAEEASKETQGGTSRSNRINALTSSESSTMSSRLSELNKYCVSRPIWKNANIEEIDRRVRRALKLREELKQTGSSGSRARSLITSYFEASNAENASKSPDGIRSGASSTFASDLDATNKSTYPVSRDQQTSFHDTGSDDTLCQNRFQMPTTANRSSSSDDDHTKQGDAVPESVGSEAAQSGASLRWAQKDLVSTGAAEQKTQDNTVCEHEQQNGRHSRAEYTSLLEETASESASRVERPSSTVASRRPSDSNSGNSIKRAAMRNKNSPPTKIPKVENICNNTPRLVGALVQTLPQVPLSSFVEWFIETSDPNNFLLSDRPSSSSDNSPGDSPHCAFEERTPVDDQGNSKMWQTILFNEPHERNSFGNNNKEPHPVSIAPHRKVCLQDKPTCNQSEERVSLFDGLKPHCYKEDLVPMSWKNNMPQSLSSAFPSTPSSATYGMSTLSGNTGEQSDSGRNSDTKNRRQKSFVKAVKEANVSNYQLKTKGDEHLSDNIMKELCAKFAFKSILGNSVSASNVKSKHRQTERSQTSRQLSTSANQKHTVPSEELMSTDSFNGNSYFQPADAGTYSHTVSKAHLQYLPETTDDFSSGQITRSESTEESVGNCTSKQDKTDRVDSGAARTKDGITDAKITRALDEKAETQSSVDSAGTSEQGDSNGKQLIRDVDVDSRCAPGIRHILMKLRQTADVDEVPVSKTERTKITLRKCPDVTGIIARFQNIQP